MSDIATKLVIFGVAMAERHSWQVAVSIKQRHSSWDCSNRGVKHLVCVSPSKNGDNLRFKISDFELKDSKAGYLQFEIEILNLKLSPF
jgi:hypothetical protein